MSIWVDQQSNQIKPHVNGCPWELNHLTKSENSTNTPHLSKDGSHHKRNTIHFLTYRSDCLHFLNNYTVDEITAWCPLLSHTFPSLGWWRARHSPSVSVVFPHTFSSWYHHKLWWYHQQLLWHHQVTCASSSRASSSWYKICSISRINTWPSVLFTW